MIPLSPSSLLGEDNRISFLSKKVVVLLSASLTGLPCLLAFLIHKSTSSTITIGTGLLDNPVVELAPTIFKNPPGYFFFLTVLAKAPLFNLPTSTTLEVKTGVTSIIGSNLSFEKDSQLSKVGNTTNILRGLTSIV